MFDGACSNESNFGAMRTILYNGLIFQTERVHKKNCEWGPVQI